MRSDPGYYIIRQCVFNAECAACHGVAESEDGRNAEGTGRLGKGLVP